MNRRHWQLAASIGGDVLRSLAIAAGIIVFTFFVMRMIPGDIVDVKGIEGSLTYSQQTAMRVTLGLDKPWISQFFEWLGMLGSGDLGLSTRFNVPIAQLLGTVLPSTLLLGATGLSIGLVLGVGLPTLACIFPRSIFVGLVEAVTIWSITMPTFSIGIVSVLVFAVWLHWIPAIGNILVPATILGLDTTGTLAKLLYEDMKDAEAAEYVRMARAKGLSHVRVVLRHVLPNALTVIISLAGLLLGGLFTGAITMEVVFGLPGLGTLTLQAIEGRDYPVVQAIIIWLGLAVIFANLVTDIVQKLIDPRLRNA
jgi:peptide/nickel transport system permease protein